MNGHKRDPSETECENKQADPLDGRICHSRHKLAERALIAVFGLLPKRNFPLKSSMRRASSEEDPCLDRSIGRLNPFTEFVLSAKLCPILALSVRICFFNTAASELECSCLSAKLCRFWRPFYAASDRIQVEDELRQERAVSSSDPQTQGLSKRRGESIDHNPDRRSAGWSGIACEPLWPRHAPMRSFSARERRRRRDRC